MELKTALILLLLAAVGWLGYDDYAKRRLLEDPPKRSENVVHGANQVAAAPAPVPARAPSTAVVAPSFAPVLAPSATPPTWFQERLRERPGIDPPTKRGSPPASYSTPIPR